ncbi:hypothetical protein ACWGI1_00590 [Streptomyces sp. NPDC054835]|uniref:hypothetical protein n=1 Tax=Streptomyces exfoliatus TaxID=1905 RepID=UPI000467C9C4|nr:hypothetical protein [Streptomyces exfoliatus]
MGERLFTLSDLAGAEPVCGCLSCALSAVFAEHLTGLRTGYPGRVSMLGHRGAGPGRTAVPHLVTLRVGEQLLDAVVWEEMDAHQLAAWLPSPQARALVPQLAKLIPRLVRVRQALRSGSFVPSGEPGVALKAGHRYPSFLFLVQHWTTIEREFSA